MPTYRLYSIEEDAHIWRPPVVFDCADDKEAMNQARQYIDGKDLELWEGQRRVAVIPHQE